MPFDLDKMYCGVIGRGDVVIAEKEGNEKVLVVLQDGVLNETLPTVIGALIEPYEKGQEILINEVLLKSFETGLDREGVCLLYKIFTIDRRAITAKKGEINRERMKEVFKALDITLGRFRDRR